MFQKPEERNFKKKTDVYKIRASLNADFDKDLTVEEKSNGLVIKRWKDPNYGAESCWKGVGLICKGSGDRQIKVKRYPFGVKREKDIQLTIT